MSTESEIDCDVIIVGAGIGGLTLAHALLKQGQSVRILERASALENVGAGIQIPPNAVKVLRALGLEADVKARAFQPEAIEARMGQTGRHIFNIPLAEYAKNRWGAPYLHIHRAAYIFALANNLPDETLKLNSNVISYENIAKGVCVYLENDRQLKSQYLIGADGIRSTIREQMLGPDAPQFTGNMAWRVVVPTERLEDLAPNPTACAWFGPGRHGVTYRLGPEGELTNFVGVVEQDSWQEEGWSIPGKKADLRADFEDWHPVIKNVIDKADTFHRWALFDRAPLPRWIDGRAALLGDAAHPMLPFLAQGAAMAVEDAWVLADVIGRDDNLSVYQSKRLGRTSKVQAASRANMGLFHKSSPVSKLATYGPMWAAGRLFPGVVHQRMDWLYNYDVTTS